MKRLFIFSAIATLLLSCCSNEPQGFVIKGKLDMPDSTEVSVTCRTDTSASTLLAEGYLVNGEFVLQGRVGQPQPGTFITNNLSLVEKNNWPVDSIRWTYTEMFVSDDNITVTPDLKISGSEIQNDYSEFVEAGGIYEADPWEFITTHPKSVVSVFLANNLLQRAYNLTDVQVNLLESAIQENPLDTARYAELKQRLVDAKVTTIGRPLLDFPVKDIDNKEMMVSAVLPKTKYVLIDFWASWCGMCLYAMPEIRKIAEEYKEVFSVIAVSIDEKEDAWRNAMDKHPEPWPQYVTTKEGYDIIFNRYQLGAGVPYYLLLDSEGNVLKSPSRPDEVRELLTELK